MDLEGRVVLVTGASKGIGAATARLLAGEEAAVVLAARSETLLRKLEEEINAAGGRAVAVPCDCSTEAGVDALFDRTLAAFGRLDALVNNAGIGVYDPVVDGDPSDWRRMIDLNLVGLMVACKRSAKIMIPQGGGDVVNIASVAGRIGIAGWAVYCATKFGVVGFSDAFRREMIPHNVRVTLIEPGAVDTEWGEKMPASFAEARRRMTPLTDRDVAEAVLYVLTRPEHVTVGELLIRPARQER